MHVCFGWVLCSWHDENTSDKHLREHHIACVIIIMAHQCGRHNLLRWLVRSQIQFLAPAKRQSCRAVSITKHSPVLSQTPSTTETHVGSLMNISQRFTSEGIISFVRYGLMRIVQKMLVFWWYTTIREFITLQSKFIPNQHKPFGFWV